MGPVIVAAWIFMFCAITVWGVTNRWPLRGYVEPYVFWLIYTPLAVLILILFGSIAFLWFEILIHGGAQ